MTKQCTWSTKSIAVILSILLAVLLLPPLPSRAAEEGPLGLSAGAAAAPFSESVIIGIADKQLESYWDDGYDDFSDLHLTYAVELKISSDNFLWSGEPQPLTQELLEQAGIGVDIKTISGGSYFRGTKYYYTSQDYVRLDILVNSPDSTAIESFSWTVALTQNGTPVESTRVALTGKIYGQLVIEVGSADDVVQLESEFIGAAYENVSSILIVAAETGISTSSSFRKGETFYIKSESEPDAADLQKMGQYPQITDVFTLQVSDNLRNKKFNMNYGSLYHVYRASDMAYLGTADKSFAYADKYYLAAYKLGAAPPATYKVTYHPNGATYGTVPVDNGEYFPGQKVPVLSRYDIDYTDPNAEPIGRSNSYFAGWSTAANGLGDSYYTDDYYWRQQYFYMPSSDVTLYAMWGRITGVFETALFLKGYDSSENLSLDPGSLLHIPLEADTFAWYNALPEKVTANMLHNADITVKRKISKGGVALEPFTIVDFEDGAAIAVQFAKPTYDTDFDFVVYLARKGSKQPAELRLTGTLKGTGIISGGSGGSSGGSSGGGGGGGGGGASRMTDAQRQAAQSGFASPDAQPADKGRALDLTKSALEKTAAGQSAVVRMSGVSTVALDVMQEMSKAAGTRPLRLRVDTMVDNKVDVRLTVDPRLATKVVNLQAQASTGTAESIAKHFAKYFANKVTVVAFSHTGDFGMEVSVAAKLRSDLVGKNLIFYSYDRASNNYQMLPPMSYRVDESGYVHFQTTKGGAVVITDSKLASK